MVWAGLAISADNILYFADGTNIRMVDKDGIITTIVGNHQHRTHWNPMPCEGTLPLSEVLFHNFIIVCFYRVFDYILN